MKKTGFFLHLPFAPISRSVIKPSSMNGLYDTKIFFYFLFFGKSEKRPPYIKSREWHSLRPINGQNNDGWNEVRFFFKLQ